MIEMGWLQKPNKAYQLISIMLQKTPRNCSFLAVS